MSESEIYLRKVDNNAWKDKFLKFPYRLHKEDKNWVAPLRFDVKNDLDPAKNPFFEDAKMEMWLAFKDGKIAGRIAAIVNNAHNKFYNDKVGFFGFFDCIDNKEISRMLFEEASKYLKENGMDTIRGPVNPSTNNECGLLTDAFDKPNVMLMPYNPPYYVDLVEDFGFKKEKDLYALWISKDVGKNKTLMDKLDRISNMVLKREGLTVRKLNMRDFNNEVQRVREVYNNAWQDNWGFVPMTEKQFVYMAKTLKMVVDPDFVEFAEKDGEPIGFSLSIPDVNQQIKGLNGKLFPFGVFKFLANKKKINQLRVIIMGVKKEYHRKGIDAIFYRDVIRDGVNKGMKGAEISWVLEDNMAMMQTAKKLGADVYKTYRIYDKELSA